MEDLAWAQLPAETNRAPSLLPKHMAFTKEFLSLLPKAGRCVAEQEERSPAAQARVSSWAEAPFCVNSLEEMPA